MKKRLFILFVICFCFVVAVLPAQQNSNLLVQGLEAYRNGDWTTALFFLRKAATMPENINAETWYVLVMSEVYAGDYESVKTDGKYFIQKFSSSPYLPQVKYQMARSLFNSGDYQAAIKDFSSFERLYPGHELLPSALFWKAESYYQSFDFEKAAPLFERIVTDYPESAKVVEAAFRLELLNQRQREEKLLYLLRVTGEEYLASKEEYERLIKQYQSEETISLKRQVAELNEKILALESNLDEQEDRNNQLSLRVEDLTALNEKLRSAAEETMEAAKQAGVMSEEKKLPDEDADTTDSFYYTDEYSEYADEDEDLKRLRAEHKALKEKALILQEILDSQEEEIF